MLARRLGGPARIGEGGRDPLQVHVDFQIGTVRSVGLDTYIIGAVYSWGTASRDSVDETIVRWRIFWRDGEIDGGRDEERER